jgi:PAS domain-containing protein|tara:strand:+ start:14828 stop:15709 length:882 start_codon:yes stop_codon:yes gene_type:complete
MAPPCGKRTFGAELTCYNVRNYPVTESNSLSSRALTRTRGDLSDFLVHHRAKLTPVDVGLPVTGGRRTPGLRREEVALLAGVGLTWYTWFEQGRDIQVSEAFLLNVSRALRLDDSECCYLFLLAHGRPPPSEAHRPASVGPLAQQLMDDLTTRPAYVINLRRDIVAWNAAADRLLGLDGRNWEERNLLRMVFADPAMRVRLPAWRKDGAELVARFKCDLAAMPKDPAMLALADELKKLSPDFRHWMEQLGTANYSQGIGTILDPAGHQIDFRHEVLTVDEYRHLTMVVYFGEE